MKLAEQKKLAGCCGLYCRLCPKYQSKAQSRCPGCKELSLFISCKFYNCSAKARGFATCAECEEFPCDKYERFFDRDSFISHKVCLPNIEKIKHAGLTSWLGEQDRRRALLENLLSRYNEGRSCSFYCVATALMPPDAIEAAVKKAERAMALEPTPESDIKAKAKTVRTAIQEAASQLNIDLKLRR
jgi:hypothetical protein